MYLISELCMNPDAQDDICQECGQCGRMWDASGRIIGDEAVFIDDKCCGNCAFYDSPMRECCLTVKKGNLNDHLFAYRTPVDICEKWETDARIPLGEEREEDDGEE